MKPFKNLQLWLVLVALVLTLGLLFGGEILTTFFKVNGPMQKEVLAIKGVKECTVREEPEGLMVTLRLQKVENLQTTLEQVLQKVEGYRHQPVRRIKIETPANASLEHTRYQMAFYLEEAAASGRFIQLKSLLDQIQGTKEKGAIAKVYFHPDYFFIQLEEGGHYLYEALPRPKGIYPSEINGGDRV